MSPGYRGTRYQANYDALNPTLQRSQFIYTNKETHIDFHKGPTDSVFSYPSLGWELGDVPGPCNAPVHDHKAQHPLFNHGGVKTRDSDLVDTGAGGQRINPTRGSVHCASLSLPLD